MKVHLIAVVAGSVAVGGVRLAVLRFSRGMTCITFSSSSFPSFSLAFSLFLSAQCLVVTQDDQHEESANEKLRVMIMIFS